MKLKKLLMITTKKGNRLAMKNTQHMRGLCQSEITKYCDQLGIQAYDYPDLVFTPKEVLEMPKNLTKGFRSVLHRYYGICFYQAKTIFLHLGRIKNQNKLRKIIIHELVHYRFPHLSHRKFEDRIKLIIRGKKYKKYDLAERLEELAKFRFLCRLCNKSYVQIETHYAKAHTFQSR
jgi:hypothetical protein